MNKSQISDAITERTGLSKIEARKALDAFIEIVGAALEKDEKINLVGFGSFSVSKKPARVGRNPRTGAPIKIVAKNVVKFRPGTELSLRIN